jgi:hypothetical protein
VGLIQSPPLERIGALDLESFYPAKERFALALKLNNLFAAPGFGNWLSGAPLDINEMLYTDSGKPRIAIFSINHLNDAQRRFFVTLLANQMISWSAHQIRHQEPPRYVLYGRDIWIFSSCGQSTQ